MELNELYGSLGLALGVGLMIGLQREQSAAEEQKEHQPSTRLFVGGVRTYPLFALAGALAVLLGRQFGIWTLALSFVALAAPLAIAYADDVKAGRDRGLTSEVAFIIVFLLGAICMSQGVIEPAKNRWLVVASLAVAVTGLLSLKRPLHEIVKKISSEDIYATVKFAVVAVIVLPLLPDVAYGPTAELKVFNPYKIGWMVMLIAGISFAGYVAIRILGAGRGLGLMGALGGLVSSTATTLSFAGRSKSDPSVARACALGVVLANTVMPLRVIATVAVINKDLVRYVAIPMGAVAGAGLIASAVLYFRREQGARVEEAPKFHNPFELSSAFKFGLLFAVILFVAKVMHLWLKQAGLFLAAAVSGTTDVDAMTLTMANLTKEQTGPSFDVAATVILIAAASNSIVKASMALSMGGPGFRKPVGITFAMMLVAGGIGAAVLWLT